MGVDPQTGQEMSEFGCAMGWVPTLILESARQQRSTAAATESFRNEMVNAQRMTFRVLDAAYRLGDGEEPNFLPPQ